MASPLIPVSALCCCFAVLSVASGALFAVDLGSDFVKVSLVKPGRVPISVVHNELSKRKTTAAVAFQSETRLYGEDALTLMTKTPQRVFLRIRDFLGRNVSDPLLNTLCGGNPLWKAPYNYTQETPESSLEFDLGEGSSVITEEILGSLFSYLKAITKEEAGETVTDCVIAVPAFFGPVQKRRILDAAKLAEMNVLAVIHAHGAAALQYGIERDFTEQPQNVIIYDMGANTVQVSLISYSAYQSKQLGKSPHAVRGKSVMVGQFAVQDVAWNVNLGGDHLDWGLVHYFAQRFNENFSLDLYTSNRAVMKLKKAVGKTKHILSANTEAHIYVEELFDGQDFNDKITRTEFEKLNAVFFAAATEPLKTVLERNQVDVANLTAVELIGGGTRVPKLQAVLSEVLGSRSLDKHLDGDEAVVMGAGLVAANLSSIFRLRQFGYLDGIVYPLQLQVLEPEGWKPEGDVTALLKPKPLLPFMKRLPAKRVVNLLNVSNTDALEFQIQYNTSEGHSLPPGAPHDVYGTFTISGLEEAVKKLGGDGKIAVHFLADLSGLVSIDRADYVVEVLETEPPAEAPVPVPEAEIPTAESVNDTSSSNTTESVAPQEPLKPKKTFKKVALAVSGADYAQPSMTAAQLGSSRKVLKKYTEGEEHKKDTEKTKNALESYVVTSQNKLQDDFEVQEVTTAAQREEFMTHLTSVEDWLYLDGADATSEVFNAKMEELKRLGDPIFDRAAESINRPLTVEQCKKTLDFVYSALQIWPDTKPWLKDDLLELSDKALELRTWLKEQEDAQAQLEPHEPPAFTTIDVIKRLVVFEKLMKKISNKKAPKPKPPPVNETAQANVTSNNDTTTTEGPEPTERTENGETAQEEIPGEKTSTEDGSEERDSAKQESAPEEDFVKAEAAQGASAEGDPVKVEAAKEAADEAIQELSEHIEL